MPWYTLPDGSEGWFLPGSERVPEGATRSEDRRAEVPVEMEGGQVRGGSASSGDFLSFDFSY